MGFADHSSHKSNDYLELNRIAYLLGVKYFEKHIVLDKGKKRIDYESAFDNNDFHIMRNDLDKLELILGDGNIDYLNEKEVIYKDREKKIVYCASFLKGKVIENNDICYKVTGDNTHQIISIEDVVGKTLTIDVKKNNLIEKEDYNDS